MNIIIREACIGDKENIIESQIIMAKETENMNLDRATVTLGVEAVFNDPTKGHYMVAEFEEKFMACLLTVPEWSDWRNSTVLWIHSVFVKPEYRGQKVFKKMYAFLQSMVNESKQYTGLRLYVDKTNEPAQKVYKAIGMNAEHYDLYEWLKG